MTRFLCLVVLALLATSVPAAAQTGWAPTGSMATARSWHTATLLPDGRVLVAGGDTQGTAEIYDPRSGTWRPTGALVTARSGAAAARLPGGRVLVFGGHGAGGSLKSAEVWDPATGRFTEVGSLSVTRDRPAAAMLPGGKVLAIGGSSTDSAEVFNPATNAWSAAGTFTGARMDASAVVLGNHRVLLVGGYNGDSGAYPANTPVYDALGGWSAGATMSTGRSLTQLTLLGNGKALATGGDNATSQLGSAELYDPANNRWDAVPGMGSVHYWHAATRTYDGRALVTGGQTVRGGPPSSVATYTETYDPAANAWAPAGNMGVRRYAHTATLLNDGRVLVTGGYNSADIRSAELWTPPTTLSSDPAAAFGDLTLGASTTAPVQITNTGDSPLLISHLAIGGAQPGDFGVASDPCSGVAIAPRATCILTASFAPTAAGVRGATLSFEANTVTGTHVVALAGRGVAVAPSPPPLSPLSPPPLPPPPALERIIVTLAYAYADVGRKSTKLTTLTVKDVPAGATVTATCSKRCSHARYVKRNARGRVSLKPLIKKRLKVGTVVAVVVAQPGKIAAVKTLTIRSRRKPTVVTRCEPPGTAKPQACT